jgi:hypothetical protein
VFVSELNFEFRIRLYIPFLEYDVKRNYILLFIKILDRMSVVIRYV